MIYIFNTRSPFKNCEVIIVYEVTAHNKCSAQPELEPMHAWTTRRIRDCGAVTKVVRWLKMV